MYKVYNYLQNYVKIKISGYKPQRFINICLRRRLKIWELTQINEEEFTLCISVKDFKKNVRSIAKKSGIKVKVLNRYGVSFKIKKYKHRKILMFLLMGLFLVFIYLNSIVWNISVEGADATTRQSISNIVEEIGIKKGTLMNEISVKKLADQLLLKQKNLSWVGIKKQGTTLKIELIKGAFFEEKKGDDVPRNEPCDVAVSKDCLLYKVTVEEGVQIVETGNTALAGQTIVMGNGKHASAQIWGCVWYKAEVPVRDKLEELVYTGKYREKKSFLLFSLKFSMPEWAWLPWNWNKEKYDNYDTLYYENYLGKKKKFPLGIGTEVIKETDFVERKISGEEANFYAKSEAQSILDDVIPNDARVLSTTGEFIKNEKGEVYVLTAEVLENVGITVNQ